MKNGTSEPHQNALDLIELHHGAMNVTAVQVPPRRLSLSFSHAECPILHFLFIHQGYLLTQSPCFANVAV